jgi:AcrR family transcriptional regulator
MGEIPESHSNRLPERSPDRLPRRRKAARRSEILAAAREVFTTRPYDESSISDIASRAGCVEGTIYTYFRNKRELFDAVLESFFDALIVDIAPLRHDPRHAGSAAILIARHLQISLDDPGSA